MHTQPWHIAPQDRIAQVQCVKACMGWDMAFFDDWLFSDAYWRSFPKVRQQMLEQRFLIAKVCKEGHSDVQHLSELLLPPYVRLKRLAGQCKNCTEAVKTSFLPAAQQAPYQSRKLGPVEVARIRRQWQHLVDSGHKYGALSLLARQYHVSSATIKKMLA